MSAIEDVEKKRSISVRRIGLGLGLAFLVLIAAWLVLSQVQAGADSTREEVKRGVEASMWSEYGQGQFLKADLINAADQTYDVRVIHHDLTEDCLYSLQSRILKCPVSIYGGG